VFPGSIGPFEIILVLAIALVVLGPKKLPEVGRSIGNGMREFRESMSGLRKQGDEDEAEELPPGSTA
jgi:sec-independent protein translocase protein TatA